MPKIIQIPFIKKKQKYTGPPIVTENKRGRIWKDKFGHRIKRKGKYKGHDFSSIHFWCHICGRIESYDAIEAGVRK